jgi:hypothetical protein
MTERPSLKKSIILIEDLDPVIGGPRQMADKAKQDRIFKGNPHDL